MQAIMLPIAFIRSVTLRHDYVAKQFLYPSIFYIIFIFIDIVIDFLM
jgi:hypothetical protein